MSKLDARIGGVTGTTSKRGNARVQGSSVHFGLNPVLVASYAFQNLQDNFTTYDSAVKWNQSYGTVTGTGGRARITCDTGYSGLWSQAAWQLSNSYAYARIYPAASNGASTAVSTEFLVVDSDTGGGSTNIGFYIDTQGNTIYFQSNVSFSDPSQTSLTYDSTNHAWLRILSSGSSVYWDTSPDGTTWTTRRTATAPAWITKTNSALTLQVHRDNGTSNYSEIDNVNVLS